MARIRPIERGVGAGRLARVRQESQRTVSVYIKGRHLKELAAEPGQFFRWRFLTRELCWQSHPYSLSATTLRQLAPGVHRMDVYLCGPPGMTGTAVAALTEAGVPRRRIHCESFEF